MEGGNAPEAGRPGSVAVIGVFEGDKTGTLGVAGQLMELHRHLERHLDGGGTVVRIKNARQCLRRKKCHQLFGEPDGRFVGEAEKRTVGEFRGLGLDRADDVWM